VKVGNGLWEKGLTARLRFHNKGLTFRHQPNRQLFMRLAQAIVL